MDVACNEKNSDVSNSRKDTSTEMTQPGMKIPTFLNIYKSLGGRFVRGSMFKMFAVSINLRLNYM